MPKPAPLPRSATVVDRQQLAPNMVRLHLHTDDLSGVELPFTDHYVKLVLPTADEPVRRAYTIRNFDRGTGVMTLDFVTHDGEGVGGPWAATVQPGERVTFLGPGGAWGPTVDYDYFMLVGDESAAPAIAATIEALPDGIGATVFLEVANEQHQFEMPQRDDVHLAWVLRGDAPSGERLAQAVRYANVPEGRVGWFVHGVAEMVRDLRHLLFLERRVPREDVSISGY